MMNFRLLKVLIFFILFLCSNILASTHVPSLFSRDLAVDGVNATITSLSLANDKQSYHLLLKTGQITFRVALDTGSSDLWITSSACTTKTCDSSPRYPLTYHSPTFTAVDNNFTAFSASYADGTAASGFVAKEDVSVGNLTIPQLAFGLITRSNLTFVDQVSGLLGLGFSRLSTINRTATQSAPFLATLVEKGLLDYPLFGISLTEGSSGTLALGSVDGSVVKNVSDIEWSEVVQFPPIASESTETSYWQWALPLKTVFLNGNPVSLSPSYPAMTGGSSIAVFDVGTSGIYGPWSDVARIFSGISEARLVDTSGQWAVPCDTSALLTFTFGSRNFTLQPVHYLIGPTAGNPRLCLSWPRAVAPTPDAVDWLLGSPFLRSVYSIFSYGIDTKEPPMIGLYALNSSITATTDLSSLFSSLSATVATTLPNSLLNTPTPSTAPYGLNSSFTAPTGGIVASGLANSTYSPILAQNPTNLSAIPIITASPTVATFTFTNPTGGLSTLTSHFSAASVVLGVPPGWYKNGGSRTMQLPMHGLLILLLPITILLTIFG
ncbi:acid protease [Marasmius fiardii PR-910]|nr:acid protease [Marasmius fiardii PR-910]